MNKSKLNKKMIKWHQKIYNQNSHMTNMRMKK